MATTSAWAVGSLSAVTQLAPRAIISPSLTMTAPKGPPAPLVTLSVARRMASRMNLGSGCKRRTPHDETRATKTLGAGNRIIDLWQRHGFRHVLLLLRVCVRAQLWSR